ncbi:MAG TPA: outer membrane beta-barrel protein [Verrucomicrobiae bacterium]|nr:outer membrane beta-barrel protein [Verrucomicrobiae bacterium]
MNWLSIFLVVLVNLLPLCAFAQSPAAPDQSGSPTAQSNSDATDAAILQELEQMRARIQELEAQLKQRSKQADVASPNSGKDSNPGAKLVSDAAVSVQNVEPAPKGSENTAAPESKPAPFSFADFTWLNGNARTKEEPLDTKFFTPEVRADVDYVYDFNHPKDDTIGGSSEVFRAQEFQLTQFGVGGDFHYDNVQARLMTQFGMYSATTPRNDASPARGNWDLDTAYRYVSEAYGGYHFNVMDGINVQAGIFMSYVGLFSYYNFDNWAYQPSYVSSNTPWFFNGMRVQIFPTEHLKIEPWFVNGWQSYGRFNNRPGIGMQILWRPNGSWSILGNQYALGEDDLGAPGRVRYHTDDSIEYKYYENPARILSKAAFSVTADLGCEHGGGVSCATNSVHVVNGQPVVWPKQAFLGFMLYNRLWFDKDRFGFTVGGGKINNPGRYLVLLPPINGATAISGTPYFTENPGDPYKAWDASGTFDYMPSQYVTFRWEFNHRHASVPYFTGSGGITPPGGDQGAPGSLVSGWTPDLRHTEDRATMAILVKF